MRLVFALAVAIGGAAAWHYWRAGLTLSHYDARAHLVVARRVIDSLTPGWRQLGAVWLPLPHLLNAMPVQLDWNFRTGFSAVAISISGARVGSRVARPRTRAPHELGRRRRARAARGAPQSQRALSAEHADDRAAAVRPGAAVACSRSTTGWPRPHVHERAPARVCAGRAGADALRGLADRRRAGRARVLARPRRPVRSGGSPPTRPSRSPHSSR